MATANPYATPEAVLERSGDIAEYDQTGVLSSRGRFGRITYLYWNVALSVPFFLAFALIGAISGAAGESGNNIAGGLLGIAMFVFGIFMVVAYWIIIIRRLHDMNWSGWVSLLMIVPIASSALALILMFVPGTSGHNNYGPPAKPYTRFQLAIALLLPALFIAGMIAAIAIPAYSNYAANAGAM